jgi:hypothetical protein
MRIRDFGTGIQIHPECNEPAYLLDTNGRYIEIKDNLIHDVGPAPPLSMDIGGFGYGIHSACVKNLSIRNNIVEHAVRHAIYYGGGNHSEDDYLSKVSSSHVFIEGNLIINSGRSEWEYYGISNIPVARTSFVTIANNTIVNPNTIAISVESEDRAPPYDPTDWHPQNVFVFGNRIFHSDPVAFKRRIWLIVPDSGRPATERVSIFGNLFNNSSTDLIVFESKSVGPVHPEHSTSSDGTEQPQDYYAQTTPTSWTGVQAVAPASNDRLYLMQGNLLHLIDAPWRTSDPGGWTYTYSSTDWAGFHSMSVACPYLFILQSSVLHRLPLGDINSYEIHRYFDGTPYNWSGTQIMHGRGENLYIVQNESAHRIRAAVWEIVERPGDFLGVDYLTSVMEHVMTDMSEDSCDDFPVSVDEEEHLLPREVWIGQNFPNPFNPATTIEFTLPRRSRAILVVYNTLGQQVRKLADQSLPVGTHRLQWDGKDDMGNEVSSGVYFYRLEAGDFVDARKMILMR